MNKEIKDKWLAALRSGEYKQGQKNLRSKTDYDSDRFCCLGVLCDIIDPSGWAYRDKIFGYSHCESYGRPNNNVAMLAELDDADFIFSTLIGLNDAHLKSSFAEIADFIETNL